MAALDEAQRQILQATPPWINLAFAFAVIGGVLGALCLLLRRRWAVPMFAVSLLAVLVQFGGGYLGHPGLGRPMGSLALAMPGLVLVVALALLVYSRRWRASGWLR
ncbi:hypothetical protein H1235_02690 [Pseudoxanthomonas sp. NC8]|nr:hypothetical protein H1235_02690 [Pseudoxanthomonas sp. NC8]